MNYAIILIAGEGKRFSNKIPKQFVQIGGKPLYFYTLEKFVSNSHIDEILLVVHKDYILDVENELKTFNFSKKVHLVIGGSTRQESSFLALKSLRDKASDNDIVLIHDGARPLVSEKIINENIKASENNGAITTAIKVKYTIGKSEDNFSVNEYVDRSNLYEIQTPQTFNFGTIFEAHELAIEKGITSYTDDSSVVLASNQKVALVEGSPLNIKITTLDDLELFKKIKGLKNEQF